MEAFLIFIPLHAAEFGPATSIGGGGPRAGPPPGLRPTCDAPPHSCAGRCLPSHSCSLPQRCRRSTAPRDDARPIVGHIARGAAPCLRDAAGPYHRRRCAVVRSAAPCLGNTAGPHHRCPTAHSATTSVDPLEPRQQDSKNARPSASSMPDGFLKHSEPMLLQPITGEDFAVLSVADEARQFVENVPKGLSDDELTSIIKGKESGVDVQTPNQ